RANHRLGLDDPAHVRPLDVLVSSQGRSGGERHQRQVHGSHGESSGTCGEQDATRRLILRCAVVLHTILLSRLERGLWVPCGPVLGGAIATPPWGGSSSTPAWPAPTFPI